MNDFILSRFDELYSLMALNVQNLFQISYVDLQHRDGISSSSLYFLCYISVDSKSNLLNLICSSKKEE